MLQKTVYKSRAVMAAICIAAALVIVSLFPLRLWRVTVPFEGSGTPLVMSETADTTHGVSQVFTAAYDRLKYLDVYVAELTGGRYLEAELRSADGDVLFRRVVDLAQFQLPGYVRLKAGVALKTGLQYRLYLHGKRAAIRFALEPAGEGAIPGMGAFFAENTPHASLLLHMVTGYDVPLSKGRSLLLMGAVFALAAALVYAVRAWFLKRPEGDTLLLLSGIVEKTLYMIAGAFYLALFILNFPMKRFYDVPGEIALLGAGIVVAAVLTFYAIHRFCTEPENGNRLLLKGKVAAVFFALAIAYGCEYMNGESNLMHSASERQMLVCLLAVVLLSFRTDMLVNRMNVVWAFASSAGGAWHVYRYALHAATMQEKYQNTVIRCNVLLIILGGLVLLSAVRSARARVWKRPRLSAFGILTFLLIAVLLVTSASRASELILLTLCAVFYVCIGCNVPVSRFLRVLALGVNINFLLTMGYCLLFRAYQGFIFARYGMVFPTVAVTGEYLASITLVAAAQLLTRFAKDADSVSWRMRIRHAWRELYLFSFAGVYALLTLSRTAYLTIGTGVLILLVVYCAVMRNRKEDEKRLSFPKRFLLAGCTMVCTCVVFLPGLFSMQRILPAMVGRHKVISRLEQELMMHDLLGAAEWDSTYYISGIRLWSMFRARILGLPELAFVRMEDPYNYDEYLNVLYTEAGEPIRYEDDEEEAEITSFADTPAGSGENVLDVSNGRLDIFRTYLSRLSMRGHGVLYTQNPDYIHAHNTYLQEMYTYGIPAGALFTAWTGCAVVYPLVLYAKAVRHGKREEEAGGEYLITAALTLAFAMAGLTEMNFQLCNPMCMLLFTGIISLVFRKEEAVCSSNADSF